jgi:hypothetical protein
LKFKASILFLCLFIYITELATLPTYCQAVPEELPACSAATECCAGSCKKSQDNEKDDPNESQPDCYLNCPLCYATTLTGVTHLDKTTGVIEQEYSLFASNYIFIFCSTTWKPPDMC